MRWRRRLGKRLADLVELVVLGRREETAAIDEELRNMTSGLAAESRNEVSAMRQAGPRPDVDTSTPAVVLKLDPNPFHHGGLGVIRSLGRLGVPVYAVSEGPL